MFTLTLYKLAVFSVTVAKMAPSSDFGLDAVHGTPSMEVTNMEGSETSAGGMDSDELVPSLQVTDQYY